MRAVMNLGFMALLALGFGCSKVEIQSNRRVGYSKKIERILVVISHPNKSDVPFFDLVRGQLESRLKARNVQAKGILMEAPFEGGTGGKLSIVVGSSAPQPSGRGMAAGVSGPVISVPLGNRPVTGLPVPEGQGSPMAQDFAPSHLLKITEVSSSRSIGTASATIRMALSEPETGLMIWKAELYLEWGARDIGGGIGPVTLVYSADSPIGIDALRCAEQIIKKLETDELLPPLPAAHP